MKRLFAAIAIIGCATVVTAATLSATTGMTRIDFAYNGIQTSQFCGEQTRPGTTAIVTVPWTSNSSGAATVSIPGLAGTLVRYTINPGPTDPTDNYDMTLTDLDGVDVLGGAGANLDTTATTTGWVSVSDSSGNPMPMTVAGNLSLNVTNAGNTKNGVVRLYLKY